ncbi:MAG: hypothetical protein ACKVE4_12245 [Dissulfuribacterales bacterium]
MNPKQLSPAKQSRLNEVLSKFEQWRQNRPTKRQPIPDHLWLAAGSLHPEFSVYRISRALHLDYNKLKYFIRLQTDTSRPPAAIPEFIELSFNESNSSCEYVVEMQQGDGSQMKIMVSKGKSSDLLSLAQLFWYRT